MIPQFQEAARKSFCYENFSKGLMAVAFGLAKKVLLADTFGKLVDWGYADVGALDTVSALLVMLAYTLQIYFDFSGYSDMAIGLGAILGFHFPENFNYPYISKSITEFWRRWHISLSTFFRDYVYIPLGGSRCSKARKDGNLIITFLVSGLWHGAGLTYLVWGGLHGLCQAAENHLPPRRPGKLRHALRVAGTFCILAGAFVIFRASSLANAADLMLIAPATANVIAKLAHGQADDMLTTVTLAATCPKLVAPAMNTHMLENPNHPG